MKRITALLIMTCWLWLAYGSQAFIPVTEYGHGPSEGLLEFPSGSEILTYGVLTNGEAAYPGQDLAEIGFIDDVSEPLSAQCDWVRRLKSTVAVERRNDMIEMVASGNNQDGRASQDVSDPTASATNMIRVGVRISDPTLLRYITLDKVVVDGVESPVALASRGLKDWMAVDVPVANHESWKVALDVEYSPRRHDHPVIEVFVVPYYNPLSEGEPVIINAISGSLVQIASQVGSNHGAGHLRLIPGAWNRRENFGELSLVLETGFIDRIHTIEVSSDLRGWMPLYRFCPESPNTRVMVSRLNKGNNYFRVITE